MRRSKSYTRRLGILGAMLLLLCPALDLHAQPKRNESRFLKGRLLVKYHDSVTECVHCLLKDHVRFQDATSDRSDSLDRLHAKYRVTGAKAVFRSDAEDAELTQRLGRRPNLSDLRQHHRQKTALARARRALPAAAPSEDLAPIYVLELDETLDVAAVAKEYAADLHVAFAHPDYLLHTDLVPTDPYYSSSNSWSQGYADLWGLKKINPEPAWDQTQGAGIIVAVVDTGVDTGHPDLATNIQPGGSDYSTCSQLAADGTCVVPKPRDSTPEDLHGHGTHVAGIIAAVGNTQGIIGVAPQAKVLPVKALGDLTGAGLTSDVADAIVYAADQNAKVINLSLGDCQTPVAGAPPYDIPTLTLAVNHAVNDHGVVVIASAGNDAIDIRHCTPANLPNVITVGASNQDDVRTYFSNVGWKLDVVAPGGGRNDETPNILSLRSRELAASRQSQLAPLVVGTDYLRLMGTSQAAPHVSGLAALLLAKNATWSSQDVRSAIRLGADDVGPPGLDFETGYGRINLIQTLNQSKRVLLNAYVSSHTLQAVFDSGGAPTNSTGTVQITVTNVWQPATNVQGILSIAPTSQTPGTVLTSSQDFGITLGQGESATRSYDVTLTRPKPQDVVTFNVQLSGSNFSPISFTFEVEVKVTNDAAWPRYTGGPVISSPVIADLDPHLDPMTILPRAVLVGSLNGQVFAFRPDGTCWRPADSLGCPWWPQTAVTNPGPYAGIFSSPAVGDVDGNGDLEVVIGTAEWDPVLFEASGNVYVWHHDGTLLAGWPRSISGTQIKSTPVLANLDGDVGFEVVVVAEDGTVYVLDNNGTPLPGWPKSTGGTLPDLTMASPVLAQLDGSGLPEILVGALAPAGTTWQVYAFHADGNPVAGWPQQVSGAIEAAPSVADLDGDGEQEVVLGTATACDSALPTQQGLLYVFRRNGQLSIPPKSMPGCMKASPVIGDLDEDSEREILVALYPGTVHLLDPDGSEVWSRTTDGFITSSPSLAHVDVWARFDVVVATLNGSVYVWRTESPQDGQVQGVAGGLIGIRDYRAQDVGVYPIRSSPVVGEFASSGPQLLVGADDGMLHRWDFFGWTNTHMPQPIFRQNSQRTGATWWPPVRILDPDVDDDGTVTDADALVVSALQGVTDLNPLYNYKMDLNGDGTITLEDIVLVEGALGTSSWLSDPVSFKVTDPNTGNRVVASGSTTLLFYVTAAPNGNGELPEILGCTWDRWGCDEAWAFPPPEGLIQTPAGRQFLRIQFELRPEERDRALGRQPPWFYAMYLLAPGDLETMEKQLLIRAEAPPGPGELEVPPNAPTDLAAQPLSATAIQLTWTDQSTNETRFHIERSLQPTSGFQFAALVGANIETYTDTNLQPETTYSYRILAFNAAGWSTYSNTASARTDPPGNVRVHGTISAWSSTTSSPAPVSNAQVRLMSDDSTCGGTILCSTTSTASGQYECFAPWQARYCIRASHPNYWPNPAYLNTPTLSPGQSETGRDFLLFGPCFIATAAYGSPLAPELDVLRAYRDTVLNRSPLGRAFIATYYRFSPPLARFIQEKPLLRALMRSMLRPLIGFARTQLEANPHSPQDALAENFLRRP